MATQITFDDKIQHEDQPSIPANEKLTFGNVNEIKTAVNANATELAAATSKNIQQDTDIAAINASFAVNFVTLTTDITLTSTAFGKLHLLTGTSANYTVTLPTAVGNTGRSISFKGGNSAAFTKQVIVDANSTETIDGLLTRSIATGGFFTLVSDGTNWYVINEVESAITFSASPAGGTISTDLCTYALRGKQLTLQYHVVITSDGTSIFTVQFPSGMTPTKFLWFNIRSSNNGTGGNGYGTVTGASATISLFTTVTGTGWTTTGGQSKQALFSITVTIS